MQVEDREREEGRRDNEKTSKKDERVKAREEEVMTGLLLQAVKPPAVHHQESTRLVFYLAADSS